jgi:hypothetical protein
VAWPNFHLYVSWCLNTTLLYRPTFLYLYRLPPHILIFHLIFYCQTHLEPVILYTSILFFYENCSSKWCIDFMSLCRRLLAWHFKLAHTNLAAGEPPLSPPPTHTRASTRARAPARTHAHTHTHTQLYVVKPHATVNSLPSVSRFSLN